MATLARDQQFGRRADQPIVRQSGYRRQVDKVRENGPILREATGKRVGVHGPVRSPMQLASQDDLVQIARFDLRKRLKDRAGIMIR